MLINRSCKASIVRPNPDYINCIARYIPVRLKTLENLKKQLFPEDRPHSESNILIQVDTYQVGVQSA